MKLKISFLFSHVEDAGRYGRLRDGADRYRSLKDALGSSLVTDAKVGT